MSAKKSLDEVLEKLAILVNKWHLRADHCLVPVEKERAYIHCAEDITNLIEEYYGRRDERIP